MTTHPLPVFLAVFALFVVAYGVYVAYPIVRGFQRGADLIERAVAYEQHPENPSHTILVAGDSTGVGVGASDPTESTAGRLGQEYPNADITNISKSGAKLEELEQTLRAHARDQYDLILIQIGANDVVGFSATENIRTHLRNVLDIAHERGARVIVLSSGDIGQAPVLHFPVSTIMTNRTRNVRAIFIEETSKYENVAYVDLFRERSEEPFSTDINRYYAPDHFHPSGDGYALWYKDITKKLNERFTL